MSLQPIILSLISDIDDPAVRTDIASTIVFLKDVYLSGKISKEKLAQELRDVVRNVLEVTHPELLPEELEKKTKEYVGQLIRAIAMETLRTRILSKYRPTAFPE